MMVVTLHLTMHALKVVYLFKLWIEPEYLFNYQFFTTLKLTFQNL